MQSAGWLPGRFRSIPLAMLQKSLAIAVIRIDPFEASSKREYRGVLLGPLRVSLLSLGRKSSHTRSWAPLGGNLLACVHLAHAKLDLLAEYHK